MDVTQLTLSWLGWPNGEKLALICVQIWSRPKWAQVIASQPSAHKPWPNGVASRPNFSTCSVNLRLRLTRAFDNSATWSASVLEKWRQRALFIRWKITVWIFRKFTVTNGTAVSKISKKEPGEVYKPTILTNSYPEFPLQLTFLQESPEFFAFRKFNTFLNIKWSGIPSEKICENFCVTRNVVLFSEISRKCFSIRHWKFPEVQTSLVFFIEWKAPLETFLRNFRTNCSRFEILARSFLFNKKRRKTRAYNESINHYVLFPLSELSTGYFCLFKTSFFTFVEVLKLVLWTKTRQETDAHFYNTDLKLLQLIRMQRKCLIARGYACANRPV